MNKDNAKDYLPLVQALADGKVIQIKSADGRWSACNPTFTISADNYRVKPEPQELWAWYDAGGRRLFVGALAGAEAWRNRNSDPSFTVKHFVEVQ